MTLETSMLTITPPMQLSIIM